MTPEQAEAEFNTAKFQVLEQMASFIRPFVSPISRPKDDHGEQWGSGSFVEIGSRRFLASCEHVFRPGRLAFQFYGSTNVYHLPQLITAEPLPIDAGLALIPPRVWEHTAHGAEAIGLERFAEQHSPVHGELLFMAGYSGAHSSFAFGTLNSPGTPYMSQEIPLSEDDPRWDPKLHFALGFNPALAVSADPRSRGLPNPPGFSGSLVWNTRFVECCHTGELWDPSCAQVTGMIWGWPSQLGCILATRVEHLRLAALAEGFAGIDLAGL